MYEIFGEFDSAAEINATAAGLLEEGDTENIKVLAKENGLEEMVEIYLAGAMPELTDPFMAAVGKLNIEKETKVIKDYGRKIPAEPIVNFLQSRADETDIASAIRQKGKTLEGCLKYIESEAKKIVKESQQYLADMTVFLMGLDYYMKEGEADGKEETA